MAGPLRILIVEDDPMMQLGLEQSLTAYPQFEIIAQAEDGFSGVEAARNLQPDLVVMDIGLPGLDGIAATHQIKAEFPQIHVVILTSHQSETEVVAALASGADAYCIKGATVDRLVTAITAAQEGATYLDPQIARQVVQHLRPPQASPSGMQLSQREMDVLQLMVEGLSNPEIADKLFLSPNTIKTHVRGIMNKLSVDDRVQAAVVALRTGLV
ncbi:response regulator transcription factor [Thermosynechococcaceae cyanobacterium BACA0444]|uniref:Response regulator transcription factor n=1 Tax=Pseudocalidococcus azoricus BACA0444 TaxID=2918990 RepID=A0AAE4JXT5_9CYAN|nr:response regulator transcription factor [Pseudocalidococcus azoricus]MDS3860219.1 response regulator transcription factor [Pseudocalidococcus azoricus BACA0444]